MFGTRYLAILLISQFTSLSRFRGSILKIDLCSELERS